MAQGGIQLQKQQKLTSIENIIKSKGDDIIMNKTWTRKEIETLLKKSDTAVERGIIRLFKNRCFSEADRETGTHFAQWLLGMNGRSETIYEKKDLDNPRALRRFRRRCVRGETPMDQALRIALLHSEKLMVFANENMSPNEKWIQLPLNWNSNSDNDIDDMMGSNTLDCDAGIQDSFKHDDSPDDGYDEIVFEAVSQEVY